MPSSPRPVLHAVLTPVVSLVCGLAWVLQLFLPWAGVGALSASTGADVWRLSRDGLLPSDLAAIAWSLVVLPVLGVGAVAVTGGTGARARLARRTLLGAGAVCAAVLVTVLGAHVQGSGPGLLLTGATGVLAAVVVGAELITSWRRAPAASHQEVR